MFIQNLRIDRFGSVANLALDNLTQGITIVHGGPGTGKATLLQFARAILYGFDEATRSRYLPSTSSDEFGGSITWARGHHHYTIRRHDDGRFNGHVEFLDDGQSGSQATLTDALRGISDDLYSRLYAVDFSHRPDVSALLAEAANCGFRVEGKVIDTVKLQELKQRLATLQATLATLPGAEQTGESLRVRRRELLEEIARLELDTARHHSERTQTQSQIEAVRGQLETARQELLALRKAIDELKATRLECRSRLATAEAAAANSRTHETEIRALEAQIDRWQTVLREAAARYESLGKQVSVSRTTRPQDDDFEANLVALDTYLCELELTARPELVGVPTRAGAEYAPKMRALRDRLVHLRKQLGAQKQTGAHAHCDCERKQLTRTQAELQVSLRYLEEERDALVADSRPSLELTNEIHRLRQQLEDLDTKEAELQQRLDAVTLGIRQKEIDLAALQQRLHGLGTDLAERLTRHRDELQQVQRLLNELERRQAVLESITETEHQIRQVSEGEGESEVLRAATNYLRRISANEFDRIEVAHGKHVWVADAKGHRLSWGHLSEGLRDKVYLSLCLALVEAHDRRHTPLPMIWKDVFTNFDSRHVPETAELLCNFCRDGRQILLLTRHEHVATVFRLKNAPERQLLGTYRWESPGPDHTLLPTARDVNHLLTVAGESDAVDVDLTWEREVDADLNGDFFLYEDSPIERSPSLSSDNVVRLRRLDITMVGDLLEASADDIAANLSYAGISGKMVANWQSQALLMCHVARLREYDARILVGCGITDPNQLRQIPPTEVRAMIERFAESSEGRAMLLSGTEFELSRVTDWVRTDEYEHQPQRYAARDHARSSYQASSRSASASRSHRGQSNGRSSRVATNRGASRVSESSSRPSSGRSDGRSYGLSSRTATPRTGDAAARTEQQAGVVKMKSRSESHGLRFYLESDDGVVDAPSIGPRTAERLEKVGVVTVSDFLAADVDEVASRLQNKRMSAKMLREWQQQTELVCRVPQLRGHDAQILVAVGVTEAEALAAMDAQELWSQVEPFVHSTAGKRIIRSSKAPDFQEVFHWIEWASQARALKVA